MISACGGGGGGGGGGGNGQTTPTAPVHDWGPIPPGPRLPGAAAPTPFVPVIEVANSGPTRTATLRASVPFPWGLVTNAALWSIESRPTAWLVLQRWPDRSIRIAQAQWTETLPAGSNTEFRVVPQPTSLAGAFQPHPVFASGIPGLAAEVDDRFGVTYAASWSEAAEVVQESALIRVRRWRDYHRASPGAGIGRDFLTSNFYVTEFRDHPIVVVDWVPGNDYLGADDVPGSADPNLHALGGVTIGGLRFLCRDMDLALAYRGSREGILTPVAGNAGFTAYTVMTNNYISDGQMRRYRFLLLRDDPAASPTEQTAARASAQAMFDVPVWPLAAHDSWVDSWALGLLGGPGPAPGDAAARGAAEFAAWNNAGHFGTWGTHGDAKRSTTTGTPRNHPLSPELAHAVQSRNADLLIMLEQKAWTQAMRPYHLHGLRVGNDDDLLLWDGVPLWPGSRDLSMRSLGRRRLRQDDPWPQYRNGVGYGSEHAHGYDAFDIEHWSMDLVFDYWTVSGDAWARDEMRQLGESLRGILRPLGYETSKALATRAEGWAMQGFVQAFLATDDLRYRDAALDRAHDIVERDRWKNHVSGTLSAQQNDPRTGWPNPHKYYMPWQHGAVFYGYLGAWKFFGDPLLLEICDDATRTVEHSWVRNITDPTFGFVANGLRYYTPVEFEGSSVPPDQFDASHGVRFASEPLGGAQVLLVGGLLTHARSTGDRAAAIRAAHYGTLLLQLPLSDDDRWDKWFYCVPSKWNH